MATDHTVEELERQLAELRGNKSSANADVVEGTIDGIDDALYLYLRGEKFECRRVSTTYPMMKFAKAQRDAQIDIPKGLPDDNPRKIELTKKRNEAGMLMMSLLLETANILLKPSERERFDEYATELSMSEEGMKLGELEDALGEVIAAAGGEKGKAQPTTSPESSASSGTTKPNSVVSLQSRATGRKRAPAKS